eukprot:14180322-Alexandrium_andersonii.AAC.1
MKRPEVDNVSRGLFGVDSQAPQELQARAHSDDACLTTYPDASVALRELIFTSLAQHQEGEHCRSQ